MDKLLIMQVKTAEHDLEDILEAMNVSTVGDLHMIRCGNSTFVIAEMDDIKNIFPMKATTLCLDVTKSNGLAIAYSYSSEGGTPSWSKGCHFTVAEFFNSLCLDSETDFTRESMKRIIKVINMYIVDNRV